MSRKNAAGSSITDLQGVVPVSRFDGAAVAAWPFPELGAENFKAGEMVALSGAYGERIGVTKPSVQAGTIMVGNSGRGILGFAADDASGATSSYRGVYIATPDIVWQGNVNNVTTSASAQTAALDLGAIYGLTSLSGMTYVDKNITSGNEKGYCRIIGFNEQDVVPSFYGRVLFQVLENRCQLRLHNASGLAITDIG